jgi:tRNA modification GTPase
MEVDTIVATATPAGRGALALLRLSGPGSFDVLGRIAPELPLPPSPRRAVLTSLVDPTDGSLLDRGLVTCFLAPASYTGEDVAEVSVHGGPLLVAMVEAALVSAGARPAEPGEFTRRAVLHGKLDLVRAEAVADLIDADSPALHRAALHQMEGGLSQRLADLREDVLELEALVMHHVDFPDEDDPPVPVDRVVEAAREVESHLGRLLETAPEGELLREGAVAVLAGRPNAGKSSLYNALIGEERAIVTPEPGTTRDALEARISLGGYPFRLVDTAGLREGAGEIERLGIEVARRHLAGADLVLLCLPVDEEWGPAEETFVEERGDERGTGPPVLVVRTCADRMSGPTGGVASSGPVGEGLDPKPRAPEPQAVAGTVRVSVLTGEGLARLRETAAGLVYEGLVRSRSDAPLLTRRRQREGVGRAHGEVMAFYGALEAGVPAEAAVSHLREAEGALEELLGVITTDDILDRVFSRFCIGK